MSGISLEMIQTVAIGAFNPQIIEPNWLEKQQLCNTEESREFEFLQREGTEHAFLLGNKEWQVGYQRLSVAMFPSSSSEVVSKSETGEIIARVIELLPHTPVEIVGHYVHFTVSRQDWGGRPRPQLGSKEPITNQLKLAQTKWVGLYKGGDLSVEITLEDSPADGLLLLMLSFVRSTKPENSKTAMEAARKLSQDLETTRQLLKDVFDVEWLP